MEINAALNATWFVQRNSSRIRCTSLLSQTPACPCQKYTSQRRSQVSLPCWTSLKALWWCNYVHNINSSSSSQLKHLHLLQRSLETLKRVDRLACNSTSQPHRSLSVQCAAGSFDTPAGHLDELSSSGVDLKAVVGPTEELRNTYALQQNGKERAFWMTWMRESSHEASCLS